MIEIYESAVEPNGCFGAFYEQDNETAYLYLLDFQRAEGERIILAYNVGAMADWTGRAAAAVQWNTLGTIVGLFIDRKLIALLDLRVGDLIGRSADSCDDELFRSH